MLKFEKKTCQEEAEVFKALGHPTRLWIVKQLADGQEHCVCEFVDAIGVQFATISQHLTILRQAGILESDKRGQSVFYRLRCPCILDVVTCIQNRK